VEFSFLLGVLTLSAATAKDAVEYGPMMLDVFGPAKLFAGFAAAAVSAALAVKWLVAYLQKHGMQVFGWYRIAVALVVALLVWNGVIRDVPEPVAMPHVAAPPASEG